jgi:hypothetical protein
LNSSGCRVSSIPVRRDQVTLLVDRLPAEGRFDLFCAQGNHQALYRFGRNPDGSPAEPWDWENLD